MRAWQSSCTGCWRSCPPDLGDQEALLVNRDGVVARMWL